MVNRLVSLAVLLVAAMGATVLSQQASETARFEAVSVKPCDPNADTGGVRSNARPSPNRLFIPCMPARMIVRLAFMSGRNPRDADLLSGGPDWLGSERFTIEAVADPAIPRATIAGPMFQA